MQTIAHKRDRFLAPKEAAEILRVDVSVIYRAIRLGQLPSVRLTERGAIRIPRSALEPEPRP